MRLFLLAAALCARALAQGAPQLEAVPSRIEIGKTYALTWKGGDTTQPISLVLMAGPANSLSEIQKLAENVTGTSYSWKPSQNLYDGNNYALLLSQKSSYTTSQQFVISGGLANPSASSTASVESATPTLVPIVGSSPAPQVGTNTTIILGVDKKGLGKDTAAGIIAGLIGIFAALFCLFVFSVATKKLAAMPPPSGKQPDTEAGMSEEQYKTRKPSDVDSFVMQSTSSRSASPTGSSKYSPALDSPETLVNTPKNRSNDPYMTLDSIPDEEPQSPVWHMEQPRTAYASSTAIPQPLAPAAATTLPAQTYQQPNAKVSHLQPATLMPQYTGETTLAGGNPYGSVPTRMSRSYADNRGRLSPTEEDFRGRYQAS